MPEHTYGLFRNAANKRLISEIEQQKASLILFPEIEAAPVTAVPNIDLSEFDWVIFPDLYAVDHFLENITERFELDGLRVCAFGEAVADRLRFSQLHADVIPGQFDDESVFSAISAYQSPEGASFLIPKEQNGQISLTPLLKEANARVREIPVYEARYPLEFARCKTLLLGGAVDEFIFTSPQDVFGLAHYTDPRSIKMRMSATGDTTFQTLREFGVKPTLYQKTGQK